jgi:hypothetical protein
MSCKATPRFPLLPMPMAKSSLQKSPKAAAGAYWMTLCCKPYRTARYWISLIWKTPLKGTFKWRISGIDYQPPQLIAASCATSDAVHIAFDEEKNAAS